MVKQYIIPVRGRNMEKVHQLTQQQQQWTQPAPKGFAGRINGQNQGNQVVGGGGLPRHGYKPQDIRFTTHGDTLYATIMCWPGQEVVITSLAKGKPVKGKIASVRLLGYPGELKFTQDSVGFHVKFPDEKPCDYAYVLKITGLKLK